MTKRGISLIFLLGSAILTLGFLQSLPTQSEEPLQWFLDRSSEGSRFVPQSTLDPQTRKIRYFLSRDAYSQANREAELNSIRASFDQWESIPNSRIDFEEGGLMNPPLDIAKDQTNVVFWAKDSTLVADGRLDISGGLATAQVFFVSDGTITEADIVFNGVQRQWFTDPGNRDSGKTFIEGVALHEIGHMLGLAHSPVGGAVMLSRSGSGTSNAQIGLSSDEITFAQSLYAKSGSAAPEAQVKGQVTQNNVPVHGAVIILEDSHGNVTAGTVTRKDGNFTLPGLPAGDYAIRATPLAPRSVFPSLIQGPSLEPLTFTNVTTEFLPTENDSLHVEPGQSETKNLSVTGGSPAFRIAGIRRAATGVGSGITISSSPTSVQVGSQDVLVGVFSPDITSDATFKISGDGITQKDIAFREDLFGNQNLLSASIDVASDATPGMRSFIVREDGDIAYANGFLEILPQKVDVNFDGLDDTFQRKFFPLFTSAQAAPTADPDGDGFTNERESTTGSDPTDPFSLFFDIREVKLTARGTRITWESGPGKRYKVLRRNRFGRGSWKVIDTVTAPQGTEGETTQYLDTSATEVMHFYRIQAVLP